METTCRLETRSRKGPSRQRRREKKTGLECRREGSENQRHRGGGSEAVGGCCQAGTLPCLLGTQTGGRDSGLQTTAEPGRRAKRKHPRRKIEEKRRGGKGVRGVFLGKGNTVQVPVFKGRLRRKRSCGRHYVPAQDRQARHRRENLGNGVGSTKRGNSAAMGGEIEREWPGELKAEVNFF